MGRLSGKCAVIFGGGQTPGVDIGNGRAIALRFAEEGAAVFVTARHLKRAEETISMIREKNPEAVAFAYEVDATDESAVQKALSVAAEKMGKIDILVQNIGIMMQSDKSLLTVDNATIDAMIATNEKTTLYAVRNTVPYMMEHGGSVVLVSSIAGAMVGSNANMYNVTKAGMTHMGELFAGMLAKDGIRVNTIILGMVQTNMAVCFNQEKNHQSREEVIANRDQAVPLRGGQGTAWDTANAALFLASDEAKFVTGASLPVDGGTTVKRG